MLRRMTVRCLIDWLPLLGRDHAVLKRIIGTNVFGAFATIKAFYPLLKVRRSGQGIFLYTGLHRAQAHAAEQSRRFESHVSTASIVRAPML